MIIAPETLARLKTAMDAELAQQAPVEWPQIPADQVRGPFPPLHVPPWLREWRDARVAAILKR